MRKVVIYCVKRKDEFLRGKVPWSDWESFKITSLVLCVHLPLSYCSVQLFASAIGQNVRQLSFDEMSAIGLVQGSIQIAALSILKTKLNPPSWFCRVDFTMEDTLIGIITGLVAASTVMLISNVLPFEANQVPSIGQRIVMLKESQFSFYCEIIFAVLVSPVLEECIHRGIVLTCLMKSLELTRSIVISSFIFAGCHFSSETFPELFVTGGVFGIGYAISGGNLFVPTIAHSLVNVIAILLSLN
eukprot:g1180.t1